MKYAIKYYMTPEDIAEKIMDICADIGPARGYRYEELISKPRLQTIAEMAEAIRDGISEHEKLQLADEEQFARVSEVLEWWNCHEANIAFSFLFGDSCAFFDALATVHCLGQEHAIYNKLEYSRGVY